MKKENIVRNYNQLILPKPLRKVVMGIAHESIIGAHMGIAKTINKIESVFYFPRFTSEIKRYVQSCEICQKTTRKSDIKRVPLQSLDLATYPFQAVSIDLIGEIKPKSESGYRFILTLTDNMTRFPDAVCLKKIDTETVCEALLSMFSRTGLPEKITCDNGS